MSGKLVSIGTDKIVINNGKQDITINVDPGASISLNGAKAKLADLKAGDEVSTSGDPATSVSATRSKV